MITDALVNFVAPGAPLSIVGATGASFASNVIDLVGSGVGTAPHNIIGTRTVFGSDTGLGAIKPQVEAVVGTAFATSNSATLNVQFQAAVDTGAGGGYQPGTWLTLVETGQLAAADLIAAAIFARFDWPPSFPRSTMPRFLRLNFVTPAATSFTAGTVAFAIVTMVRDDYAEKFAAKNYTVA